MSFNRIFLSCVCIAASLMIATPSWGQIAFNAKIEPTGGGAACAVEVGADGGTVPETGWQTVTWTLTASGTNCGRFVLLPNIGNVDAPPGKTYSVDNIEYTGQAGAVAETFDATAPTFGGFHGNGAEGTSIGIPDPVDPGAGDGNALKTSCGAAGTSLPGFLLSFRQYWTDRRRSCQRGSTFRHRPRNLRHTRRTSRGSVWPIPRRLAMMDGWRSPTSSTVVAVTVWFRPRSRPECGWWCRVFEDRRRRGRGATGNSAADRFQQLQLLRPGRSTGR